MFAPKEKIGTDRVAPVPHAHLTPFPTWDSACINWFKDSVPRYQQTFVIRRNLGFYQVF